MAFERAAGVLLHPTSLPGRGGIGVLGAEAYRFVDTLAAAGNSLWQVLPLGPTGYGDSPYSALSAFAGNPLLIALEPLLAHGWLTPGDLESLDDLPESRVDFGRVVPRKMAVLRAAFDRAVARGESIAGMETFEAENASWLDEYCLFMALKDEHGGRSWVEWEGTLRRRERDALEAARERLAGSIAFHRFTQTLFFEQWRALKLYANERQIRIVGDIPIFVANDSVDVWSNQRLFQLDEEGTQLVDAGVPPDYFSATGQLWGNPHYRWDVMQAEGFAWWIERFRRLLTLVDVVRLDHFRGFAAAWAVPHGNRTAEVGEWVPAPGQELFTAVHGALGDLPIVAENLGVITPDVERLRHQFGFPGMYILHFAFSTDASDPSLPHNMAANAAVYTGTHDNDTTVGWFETVTAGERALVRRYLRSQGWDIAWDMMHAAFSSVATLALVPLQDVLRLGGAARMNLPGRAGGNWQWRFTDGAITDLHVQGVREMVETYGRLPPLIA